MTIPNTPATPDWGELYLAAVIETDPANVPGRIFEARRAIVDRIQELLPKAPNHPELKELGDALHSLRTRQQYCRRSAEQAQRKSA